ncbi:predicted protein [Nematostella vectensis]|uniref:Alpha-N-acetylglucosaminidase n=2 Tax=Nematostella vectensis TaxID=45351 RepID=A7RQ06_NEMVE|nr:predicted protein [Nematostella vectensis]|eukprot:XP_001638539.1 predicted protein [Nematostella vectensis]
MDHFQYKTNDSKLVITGTSGVACAMALQHFLKAFCFAHISWSGDQLKIPTPFPTVLDEVSVGIPYRFRYYQNVCTPSYSFVWWNWTRWQREIDWMALNGINLPLAFTGQEAIWQRVYLNLGLTQQELDQHFSGPAFLAWERMGNMHGWGGPLPSTWYGMKLNLQHKILAAMRNFGMTPVLPGFAGHVPAGLLRLYPKANVSKLGDWGNFNSTYCCTYLLEPSDPLFQKIGTAFIKEQTAEYGTNHIYNADTFNEMRPRSSDPTYLGAASSAVYRGMAGGDPDAVWLMQGWLFVDEGFWKPDQIKALLHGVPQGFMIVLDLWAENSPIWSRTQSFYGTPFIWCMLLNFGGNIGLFGNIKSVSTGPPKAFQSFNSTMIGTGLTMEGIEQNDMMFELMNEMGYRLEPLNPVDLDNWIKDYALRRYGGTNPAIIQAWRLLIRSVYQCNGYCADHIHSIFVWKPSLDNKPNLWYDPEDVFNAWDELRSTAAEFMHVETFRYDLVDVTRQALHLRVIPIYNDLISAYKNRSALNVIHFGSRLLEMFDDLDSLLQTNRNFLLGRWLNSAKALGTTPAEVALYEFNARNQITLWGPRGEIEDYANKMWSGLVKAYYKPRWELFIDEMVSAIAQGEELDYEAFKKKLLEQETAWTHGKEEYPDQPSGDSLAAAEFLHNKWRGVA